jgi:hypothetical protein
MFVESSVNKFCEKHSDFLTDRGGGIHSNHCVVTGNTIPHIITALIISAFRPLLFWYVTHCCWLS